MKSRSLIAAAASLLSFGASAQATYQAFGVTLLQPERVFAARTNVSDLVAYLHAFEGTATSFVKEHPGQLKTSGYLVVAVRPGQRSNIWLDLDVAPARPAATALVTALKAVPAPAVHDGMIVFAVKVGFDGAAVTSRGMPMPDDWKEAAERAGRPLEVSELVERVWP